MSSAARPSCCPVWRPSLPTTCSSPTEKRDRRGEGLGCGPRPEVGDKQRELQLRQDSRQVRLPTFSQLVEDQPGDGADRHQGGVRRQLAPLWWPVRLEQAGKAVGGRPVAPPRLPARGGDLPRRPPRPCPGGREPGDHCREPAPCPIAPAAPVLAGGFRGCEDPL